MLFSLVLGLIVLIVLILEYSRINRPMLLMIIGFSIFYWNFRGWLLYFGFFDKFSYLNPSATYSILEGEYLPFFILFLLFFFLALGYLVGFKITIINESNSSNNYSMTDLIVGYCIAGLLSLVYPICFLTYSIFVFIFVFIDDVKMKHKFEKIFLLSLSLIFLLSYLFFFSVDRRDYLAVILVFLFLLMYKNKLSIINCLIYIPISIFMIVYISIYLRSSGESFNVLFDNLDVFIKIIEVETDFSIVYDDLIYMIYKLINNEVDYLYGLTLVKPFLYIIPRELLPSKPETLSVLYSKYFNNWFYQAGGSQPVSILGDFFWNLSYLSFLASSLFGYFLGFMDKVYIKSNSTYNTAIVGVSFCMIFSMFRGPFDNFLLTFVFIYVGIYFIHRKKFIF